MKNQHALKIESLERVSKSWDKKTKNLLVCTGGAGNMFGGFGTMLHVCLHGENSIHPTGQIDVLGVVKTGYNIARGANGDNSANAQYFKGVTNETDTNSTEPTYAITVSGACGGVESAICEILGAEKDYLIN